MTIVVVGTSIEHGTWLDDPATQAWPQRLAQRAGKPIADYALPGGCWQYPNDAGESIRTRLDAALAEQHPDVVIVGGPPNDFVTTATADEGNINWAVQHAIDACMAAGVRRVVLMECFAFNDGGAFAAGWWPRLDGMRAQYNTWAWSAGQNQPGVASVGLDWLLTVPNAYSTRCDPRWFSDGLHPNRLGAALIAEAFPLDLLEV